MNSTSRFIGTNRRPSVNAGEPLEALFQAIPANLRNKVYRQLAVAFPPESGGTTELIKELNVAIDKFSHRYEPSH